jgi:hypothetical protein
MNCHRCGGTMILKTFCDYGGYSWGWKCIFCGEIIDQIRENLQSLKVAGHQQQDREEALCDDM